MSRYSDAELLAYAHALDKAYAESAAFDRAQLPQVVAYQIAYDNGVSDCGVFPQIYMSRGAALEAADDIEDEMIGQGIWAEEGGCEVIEVEVPIEQLREADQMAELRKAALNMGRP